MIIEVCAGSLKDCLLAQKCGAQRIELNSALHLGGLTPSLATLRLVKQNVSLPIICMVRPRGAGFCYNKWDRAVIYEEAKDLLEQGADGLAFGFLTEERQFDEQLMTDMIQLCHDYKAEAVCHRAFDALKHVDESIESLIQWGCDRILTSGLQKTAEKGVDMLAYLQQTYGHRIELLAGSGVNPDNIRKIIQETGIQQYHASAKGWYQDVTTTGNGVTYSYDKENCYDGVNETKLMQLIKKGNDTINETSVRL